MEPARIPKSGALMLALSLAACAEPPPPAPTPPPPPAPAPLPAPAEPRCLALRDACKAQKGKLVPIPGIDYAFAPPDGWTYALLEEATVAQLADRGAVLVLTSFESGPDADKRRGELAVSLSELVLVEPPATGKLDKPDQKTDLAGLEMALWERKGAKRGEDTGALLLLSATIDDRELFGVGFAPKDDSSGTEQILEALKSIAAVKGDAATKGEPPKDEG
jgi:hypothetical protein